MHAEVAQESEDSVPPWEENEDGPRGVQAAEVVQQGIDELKGDVPLRQLPDC